MPAGKQTSFSLRDAMYGFALFLLPAFFTFGSHDSWNLPRWALSMAFLTLALPLAAFRKQASLRFPRPLAYLLIFLLAWTLLSATSWGNSGDASYLLGIRLTGLGMLLWLVLQGNVHRAAPFLVGLGLLQAVIGLGEMLGLVTMNELLHTPIGTVGNNNLYGCLMALLLPFPLLLLLKNRGNRRPLLIGAALFIGVLAMVSTSKTAILAILLAGFVVGGLYLAQWKTSLLERVLLRRVLVPLIPLLLITAPIAWSTTNFSPGELPTEATTGITERGIIWRETIEICKEAPLLGHGPASWKYQILERGLTGYTTEYGLRFFTRPHNDFLWIAAESGLPAAAAYVALLTFLFFFALRRAWRAQVREARIHYHLLAAGVLIWIVVSSLNFPLERVDHLVIFAVYTAMVVSGEGKRMGLSPKWIGLLAAVVFGCCAALGGMRYVQDRHLHQVELARLNQQPETVLSECSKTASKLFTTDYFTSTPIALYEGIALLQLGKQEEARTRLSFAYSVNPWHPHVLNNLASSHVLLGDNVQAERYYREAIGLFRDFPDPYINLSRILVARGEEKEAAALLNSFPDEAKSHKKAILRELQNMGR